MALFDWFQAPKRMALFGGFWTRAPGDSTRQMDAMLLADAVRRAYASAATVGSSMLVVDTISERAAAFYEGNGFVRLPDSLRLVLPIHAIQQLVEP
ncbi:hypothetical protein NKH69_22585 [Mesorhizobium sp. M0976]|uniref:hypothetical protein n=1 Tax=unclassified Mesorhizobium TaxID=325217 RepID=UPI003336076A